MPGTFDPYYKWLGIGPEEQPPNHYRLLGIRLFEPDPDVIDAAANRQMAYLQQRAVGRQAALSQKLLNEMSAARVCLLSPDKKAAYDKALRVKLAAPAALPSAKAARDDAEPALADFSFLKSDRPQEKHRKRSRGPLVVLIGLGVSIALVGFLAISFDLGLGTGTAPEASKNLAESQVRPARAPLPKREAEAGGKLKPVPGAPGRAPAVPAETPKDADSPSAVPPAEGAAPPPEKAPAEEPAPPEPPLPQAEENLKQASAVAETPDDFKALAEKGLLLVDRAIVEGNGDMAQRVAKQSLVAAREADDADLADAATLRFVELQQPLTDAITTEAQNRLKAARAEKTRAAPP